MFNSETLEVAIGMAFLFLLMSLICTGINEWMEGIFKWRAMDLECAVRTLLDDNDGKLAAYLFGHPIISSLYQGKYDPSKLRRSGLSGRLIGVKAAMQMPLKARRNLPSYIPAENFSKALIDLVGRGPADVDGESAPHIPLTIAQLRERAASLNSPFLRRSVLSAIDHCEGDLKQLTENLQRWFDSSMDRASGWYRRRTQTVLFVLGLAAATVLNVDALYVMGRLTADKTFREAVVSAAGKVAAPAPPGPADAMATARSARADLDAIGMPLGWKDAQGAWLGIQGVQMCKREVATDCVPSGYSYLRMLLGWLVTAFAVMLGAPFWFDVLNKFMVIRSTVKPREKSPEEGSEDRATPSSKDGVSTRVSSPATPPDRTASAPVASSPTPEMSPPPAFTPNEWRNGSLNSKEILL